MQPHIPFHELDASLLISQFKSEVPQLKENFIISVRAAVGSQKHYEFLRTSVHFTDSLSRFEPLLQASLPSNPSPVHSPTPTESLLLLEVLGSHSPALILRNDIMDNGGEVVQGCTASPSSVCEMLAHWPLLSAPRLSHLKSEDWMLCSSPALP